ncbi:MAG TPA: hypothetical protein VGO84_03900, partial [Burkholderiales bacterium]|nr:hypothetical protein [Burkholderiales bacterium]
YVHKAIELGQERTALAMAKRDLAERTAAFFNTPKGVKELEAAYLQMWDAGSDELHRAAR